jgi:hypothetical protein
VNAILLALLVAMTAVGARAIRRVWKRRQFVALRAGIPGYSPDHPALLSSAKAIDDVVDAARCLCGGRVRNLGETSRMGLRVVRGRCRECDADVDLFFVLPKLLN